MVPHEQSKPSIRPLAVCVFRHGGKILVTELCDPQNKEIFYRPLGGGIEFGELAADTIKRELMEELGAEVHDLCYLGTLENIFTYDGQPGHEIVLVFDGKFVDESLYTRSSIVGHEEGVGEFSNFWKSLDFFREGEFPLYPDHLLELLEGDHPIFG